MTPEQKFEKVAVALKRRAGVSLGGGRKGFGASALRVGGKIFAMVSSKQAFVVKLPRARVDELVVQGIGSRFEPSRGRVMKEWLALDSSSSADWTTIAREALQFVAKNRLT